MTLATSEDFADDVLAGVEYLKSRKDIDPKQIGLIGHSEGGLIAPMAATRSQDVAFIVLMAGPGLIGEELLYLQGEKLSSAEGLDNESIARNRDIQSRMFAIVKQEPDNVVAEKELIAILNETGVSEEIGTIEETMSPMAMNVIGDWILQQVRNKDGINRQSMVRLLGS